MKTLLETNPYLQDREKTKLTNSRSARSSCGVEGIVIKSAPQKLKIDSSKSHAVYNKIKERLSRSCS